MPGFPDWQEYAQWVGDPITISGTIPINQTLQFSIPVGQWLSFEVSFLAVSDNAFLEFDYLADASGAVSCGYEYWHINAGDTAQFNIQNRGPWLKVFVRGRTGTGAYALTLTPTNRNPANRTARADALLGGDNGETIAGGVTSNHYMLPYRGPVRLFVDDPATASVVNVIAQDWTNANLGRSFDATNPGSVNQLLHFGSDRNLLQLINNDGVNRVFRWACVAIS
jgi:hypothetical protein